MKRKLYEIITNFHEQDLPEIKARLTNIPTHTGKIVSLTGVRRSGKTYHLYNIINNLLKEGLPKENIIYLNFEDERLDKQSFEFDLIIQSYRELFPEKDLKNCFFFFDEIQEVNNWEKFVRRLNDTITKNIYLTGSNSSLLSSEIATALRGRTITFEIFPLSFIEYLKFQEIEINLSSQKSKSIIKNAFDQFLVDGGFPEILYLQDQIKLKVLQEYFDVMVFRDLIERYQISQPAILKYFCKRIVGNSAKEFSVHKIYNEFKSLGYKVSKDTFYQFQDYIESIYLSSFLSKYSHAVVKSDLSQKKVYSIDTGLAVKLNYKFSKDIGRILENFVYLELIKANKEVFYYKNKKECDFLIQSKKGVDEAIQVSFNLDEENTKKRETEGLIEACQTFNLKKGYILTYDQSESIMFNDIEIILKPSYEYVIEKYLNQ
jgi:hypothetical protein